LRQFWEGVGDVYFEERMSFSDCFVNCGLFLKLTVFGINASRGQESVDVEITDMRLRASQEFLALRAKFVVENFANLL